jgi:hypothetical protein
MPATVSLKALAVSQQRQAVGVALIPSHLGQRVCKWLLRQVAAAVVSLKAEDIEQSAILERGMVRM